LDAASTDSEGATYITASAEFTSGSDTVTVTSAPVGLSIGSVPVTLGPITLGQSSISAYGTSSVSVPVLIGGSPATVPISVTFTSNCVSSGKATLTSPVNSNTSNGIAISTYKDNNCSTGSDTILASVTGAGISTSITVIPPATSNIQFVSATPAIIGTQTASAPTLSKSSLVKFKVVDSYGNGKTGVRVDFSLLPDNPDLGITLSSEYETSDANGEVTTSVISGTVPTPVWVVARVHDNPTIVSQSNTLAITTGLPSQNFFSLSFQSFNIEGWNYDGVTSTITIIASDRLGNPVPDGTVITFITEGSQITPASCSTTGGSCTVTFKSSEYKPIDETTTTQPLGAVAALTCDGSPIEITYGDGSTSGPLYVQRGRVTMLAYALGEKSFVDSNGNNKYDSGETFYDLGDLYIDFNENGTWDSNPTQPNLYEQFISYPYTTGTQACLTQPMGTPLPDNYGSAPSKENTCNGEWGEHYVRRSAVIVLSGSQAQISQTKFEIDSCKQTFSFWLMDQNYNPMPAGTTVAVENASVFYQKSVDDAPVAATTRVGGSPVLSTAHAGGTVATFTVDGGAGCSGTGPTPYPVGVADIVVTTPRGVRTSIGVQVVDED